MEPPAIAATRDSGGKYCKGRATVLSGFRQTGKS